MRRVSRVAATLGLAFWCGRAARRRRIHWQSPGGAVHRGALTARHLGDSGTPIVLLHGLAASGRVFGAAFDSLGDQHRLIVPDLLGFGTSPTSNTGYGSAQHVDALLRCADELGCDDEPMILAGHSMGALLAIQLAARHPDRVRAVVAFAPPLYRDPDEARRRIAGLGLMARLFALDTRWAHAACQWVCDHRDLAGILAQVLRPDLPGPIARDGVHHTWASYSQSLREVILTANTRALIPALRAPVHLITGDRDAIAPPEILDGLNASDAIVSIWHADHDLELTHPLQCIEAIASAEA